MCQRMRSRRPQAQPRARRPRLLTIRRLLTARRRRENEAETPSRHSLSVETRSARPRRPRPRRRSRPPARVPRLRRRRHRLPRRQTLPTHRLGRKRPVCRPWPRSCQHQRSACRTPHRLRHHQRCARPCRLTSYAQWPNSYALRRRRTSYGPASSAPLPFYAHLSPSLPCAQAQRPLPLPRATSPPRAPRAHPTRHQ